MICWYGIAKDFAGPFAAVLAAGTAATITYRFAKIQAGIAQGQAKTAEAAKEIARSQRDIAYDKLKHDLFERRYKIYSTAKEAIETVLKGVNDRPLGDNQLKGMRMAIDEAVFFFPPKEVAVFQRINDLIGTHEGARYLSSTNNLDDRNRITQGDRMAAALIELTTIHQKLQTEMKSELGFAQLTSAHENS